MGPSSRQSDSESKSAAGPAAAGVSKGRWTESQSTEVQIVPLDIG